MFIEVNGNVVELKPCKKCGSSSDKMQKTHAPAKYLKREKYTFFCQMCAHTIQGQKLELVVEKWNGTNKTNPTFKTPLPCFECSSDVEVKRDEFGYYRCICSKCGKFSNRRDSRYAAVKLHNSNVFQMKSKREREASK